VNFFFDRNIGVRLARMLDAYDKEHVVRHHDDDGRFEPRTRDVEMLRTLAQDVPRPVLVTADLNILQRYPAERKALVASGLTVVFLRKSFHSLPFHTQAVKLLRIWPEIVRETSRVRQPTAFEITSASRKVQRIGLTTDL
jgi:hypothetical protein